MGNKGFLRFQKDGDTIIMFYCADGTPDALGLQLAVFLKQFSSSGSKITFPNGELQTYGHLIMQYGYEKMQRAEYFDLDIDTYAGYVVDYNSKTNDVQILVSKGCHEYYSIPYDQCRLEPQTSNGEYIIMTIDRFHQYCHFHERWYEVARNYVDDCCDNGVDCESEASFDEFYRIASKIFV